MNFRLRISIFFILFVGMLATMLPLMRQGVPLRCAGTPGGIGELEMPWKQEKAEAIVTAWKGELKDVARENIRLDYPFIAFYSLLFAFVCQQAALSFQGMQRKLGFVVAAAMLVAGLLDVIEDVGMLKMLDGRYSLALAVSVCAASKFLLLLIGIAYALGTHVRPSLLRQDRMHSHTDSR
jgi:hypothetical protein